MRFISALRRKPRLTKSRRFERLPAVGRIVPFFSTLRAVLRALQWLVFSPGALVAQGHNDGNLWEVVEQIPQSRAQASAWVQPVAFRSVNLRHAALRPLLASAPKEAAAGPLGTAGPTALITLPMPDGTVAQFRFVEAPVMAPELAAQFPEIKTYLGQGVDDPKATVRFDLTPAGFHAQILSPNGAVYIDPYFRGDTNFYACYYKRDYRRAADGFQCFLAGKDSAGTSGSQSGAPTPQALVSGGSLRTYRLAVAATGEYTQFQGGTVAAGLAAIVTAVNRVTGVYESELAIRLVLVGNNNLIVYTNASTDPYDNSNPSSLLSQNQANLDSVIGTVNYDIGHVFSTAGGGLAGLGVACVAGLKARGETGMPAPVGDAFYIDYVAHEIGHQFGANHCFNSSSSACAGNRNAVTAYEPGSGSTIMCYAGICTPDDLQPHSDPYFHSVSFEEIIAYTTTGAGNNCPALSSTGNSTPTVSAGLNYTIPKGTPFTLIASGNDPDGDTLTYCWEERDLGPSITLSTTDNGSSPLFRSFTPVNSPSRTFPRWADILGNSATPGEMLPATSRTMQFRVTARDNRAGGGGVSTADMQVTVVTNAGPFVVTSPNSAVTWAGAQTVTWNVAGTAGAPISAANVNILLSTDGGLTFPIALVTNVPNSGSQIVVLPNITNSTARIKVEAVGNIFFDISNTNFSIVPATPVIVVDTTSLGGETCSPGNGTIDPGETVLVNFALKNTGTANTTNLVATLLATNGVGAPSGPQTYGALTMGGAAVSRPFIFSASGSCGGNITAVFQLQDGSAKLGTVSRAFSLGTTSVTTTAATNSATITISDNAAASPYPSSIAVSGLTGTVTKVTVTLRGLTHTMPDDIDALLIGPGGQKTYLMSDAGGNNSVTNLTITFDNSAATSLPDSTRISSGTYKPTNFDTNTDSFPGPAPAGPYVTNLTVFNGVNPNGTWSLYVEDDHGGNSGSIGQGWALAITTSNSTCCTGAQPSADLALGESASPSALNVGSNLCYTLTVTNFGLNTASNVIVTDVLSPALTFVSASATQGTWTNNNGVVTFSLGALSYGSTGAMTITATASAGGFITNTASVSSSANDPVSTNNTASTVVFINSPPTISAIPNQQTSEGTPTSPIGFVVGDGETPASTLSLSGASSNTNLVPNANILFGGSGSNRTVTLTPTPNHFGTTTIGITVSDGALSSSTAFLLTVNAINHAPTLAAITNYVIAEGTTLMFTNAATDVDSPPQLLTFSLSNAPAGALLNPTNGIFTWTPSETQGPSTNQVTVVVTDDGSPNLSAARTFTVVVNEVNSPPVLGAPSHRTITELTTLVVTNTATDSDLPANHLSYSLLGPPSGAAIDTNGIISWTPTEAQGPSTNAFVTVATDDGQPSLSATNSFVVVVTEVNSAPALTPIADQTILEGATLVITNTATDPDLPANTLTFSLETNAPTGASIDPTNGIFTWTPAPGQSPGTNVMTVRVSDDGSPSLSATQSFSVVVLATNLARALPPIPTQYVIEGQTLVVSNLAMLPYGGTGTLSFCLSSNAPLGAAINATNGVFSWTPTEAQGPSTNLITALVTDTGPPSLSATQSFTVVVLETNSPPALAPITDRTIHAGTTLAIALSATDPDIPTNTLTFSLEDGAPAGATIEPTSGVFTFATSNADVGTTNYFTIRVTDDGLPGLSDAKTFAVAVVSRPHIESISLSNEAVTVTWSAIAGQTYRLQYVDSLGETNWSNVTPDVSADGATVSQTDALSSVGRRFYRVEVVP